MRYAVWLGYADQEGIGHVDDLSYLDDWSHEDYEKAHCKRLGKAIEEELSTLDDVLEVYVDLFKRDLVLARTPEDVEKVTAKIREIDGRWFHPRPLELRLAKPLLIPGSRA